MTDSADIRVLLVDDQELFRAGMAVIVDHQPGVSVAGSAADGLAALEMIGELRPDVVLMDIRMPEMDGVEATRRIFTDFEDSPRVIILTTFDLDDRAARAIRYGASGFLLKDASPQQLGDAIRTVHSGNAVLAPADLARLLERQFADAVKAEPPSEYLTLTEKERMVFRAIAQGLSNAEIAGVLFVSESTVKTHVGSALRKLGVRDRVQLVVYAYRNGLVERGLWS